LFLNLTGFENLSGVLIRFLSSPDCSENPRRDCNGKRENGRLKLPKPLAAKKFKRQIYVYYNKVKSLYVIKGKNNFLYYFYG